MIAIYFSEAQPKHLKLSSHFKEGSVVIVLTGLRFLVFCSFLKGHVLST